MVAKFAVYYIPPAESSMYLRGSEILGYDVRAGNFLPADNPTRAALPEFNAEWVQRPQSYGFHMTLGYSLEYDPARLPEIEQAMEDVLNCFSAGTRFTLTPDDMTFIPFWRDEIVVLRYHPNPALLMLHAMLIARINPLASGSRIGHEFASMDVSHLPPEAVHRVRQYHTPYMLDGWAPHFTLMQPYAGSQPKATRAALRTLFAAEPRDLETVSLLTMADGDTHYRLHRDFPLDACPQPAVHDA